MELAPITLFIYNRPHYLLRTLESLSKNDLAEQSLLIVYADGPKDHASTDEIERIKAARQIVKSKNWCKQIRLIEREYNLGLSSSIISGVSEVLQEFDSIIVLEDDLELSPYFLTFMNDALRVYNNEPKVLSIGACNFFATGENLPETFFIPIPDCLGWATWSQQWKNFESDGEKLLQQLEANNLIDFFNLYGAYNFEKLLRNQIAGLTNSWAIRWQAVSFIQDKVNLYPKFALTNHIGVDELATNSSNVDYSKFVKFPSRYKTVEKQPVVVKREVMSQMLNYYRQTFSPTPPSFRLVKRLYKHLKKRIARIFS